MVVSATTMIVGMTGPIVEPSVALAWVGNAKVRVSRSILRTEGSNMKRILIALVALAFAFAIPRRLNTTRASGVAVGAISSLKKWQRNLRRKRVYRDGKERLGSSP